MDESDLDGETYVDIRHARLCVGCQRPFYPPAAPADTALACGGGYPLGDMRLSYCPGPCLAKAFAERDAFYEKCMEERRIKCQLDGHMPDGFHLPSICLICGEDIDVNAETMAYYSMRGIGRHAS